MLNSNSVLKMPNFYHDHPSLINLFTFLKNVLIITFNGYRFFLPGIFILPTMLAMADPSKGYQIIMQIGFFCFFSGLYVAGASKAAGTWTDSIFSLFLNRGVSHGILLIVYLIGVAFVLFVFFIGVHLLGIVTRAQGEYELVSGWLILSYIITARFWPMYVITFLYPGTLFWSASAGGVLWHGPSFITAWRMTSKKNTFFWITLPLLISVILSILPWMTVSYFFNSGFLLFTAKAFFYCLGLPFITMLSYCFADYLKIDV